MGWLLYLPNTQPPTLPKSDKKVPWIAAQILARPLFPWDQEKSSSGKKFESLKKSNFFPLELFSSNFFLVHTGGTEMAGHSF